MQKSILIFALMLTSLFYGQKLVYKAGNVYDENNKKLSNTQIKNILSENQPALNSYRSAKTKGTVGGLLLGTGIGFLTGDLIYGATSVVKYPTGFTYIGAIATIISIPVLIGRHDKIKNAVYTYNDGLSSKKTSFNIEKINIISTQNGIGLAIGF